MKCNKRRQLNTILAPVAVGLMALLFASCSRFSSKSRHLMRADRYFASGSYTEAEIEYKNVLQADILNPTAFARLGIIYYYEGNPRKAFPFLLRGSELQPENLDLRLKLAEISLERGDAKNARDQAISILKANSKDPDAPLLLAEASTKPDDIEGARRFLSQLPLKSEDSAASLIAMGYLSLMQHNFNEADVSFRKALTIDPKSSAANFALGTEYLLRKDPTKADQAFQTAYKLAPARSPIRLKYAQIKIQSGDSDAARHILEETVRDTPDYDPAMILLAELDAAQKKFSDGESLISKVLQRDSVNLEAILVGARISLAQGEAQKAIADLERAKGLYPKYPPIYFLLGQAYLAGGDIVKGINSLNKAIAINPNLTDAILLLARTDLRRGDFKSALVSLAQLLQQHPDLVSAQLLEAEALRIEGDLDGALNVYRNLEKAQPKNPELPLFAGMMLLRQNKLDQAREEFDKSLEISPSYLPTVEQLLNVDLIEKKYSSALQRANSEIDKNPKSEVPHLLLAKVYIAQNDRDHAESALLKTIELKPDSPTAYFLLAQLYEYANSQDKALANLKEVVAKDPKAINALMMMATIYQGQKNYTSARDAYEKVLIVDPNFASALNNLSYLYSEKFGQIDKGVELAQRARDQQPNEPHIADTLGWALYRKHEYTWALGLLQEGASKLPSAAEIQFHLGTVYYMMGEEELARAELERALQLPGGFPGSDEAKQRLSVLALDASSVGAADRAELEKSLAQRTGDPVALDRLASLYERDGSTDKAVADYQAALEINPANVATILNLARVYNLQHDPKRALEMAKAAHVLAPNDPKVSLSLSRLAYQSSDYQWAYSLFEETVRSRAEDPEVLYELANSAFSVGKVQEAEESMRHALNAGLSGPKAENAKRFLEMITILDCPNPAALDPMPIEAALNAEPGFAPARMARAEVEEAKGNLIGATQEYEKILSEFPDFSPAKRRLAILYSEDASKDQRTSDLATSASEAFPSDSGLEKAQGIVAFRKGSFSMAEDLLGQSAQSRSGDAVLLYYLGISQFELKEMQASQKTLQRALALGLNAELSAEAQSKLASIK